MFSFTSGAHTVKEIEKYLKTPKEENYKQINNMGRRSKRQQTIGRLGLHWLKTSYALLGDKRQQKKRL